MSLLHVLPSFNLQSRAVSRRKEEDKKDEKTKRKHERTVSRFPSQRQLRVRQAKEVESEVQTRPERIVS